MSQISFPKLPRAKLGIVSNKSGTYYYPESLEILTQSRDSPGMASKSSSVHGSTCRSSRSILMNS